MSAVADAVVSVVCPEALSVVVKRLVAVRAVVDALVSTELDAKMFCEKRLRNRSDDEPRENVSVTEGVVLPAIWSLSVGEEAPIPMLPFARMEKRDVPLEDATENGLSEPDP